MATQTQTSTKPDQDHSVEAKIQQFRELFADAPEIGKKALENALHELRSQASDLPPPVESAGLPAISARAPCPPDSLSRSIRLGQKADISQYDRHVGFTPESDRKSGHGNHVMPASVF